MSLATQISAGFTRIAEYVKNDFTLPWARVTDKPTTFAPSAHTHVIGDLPVATSGTSNTTQVVRADDARLSDARTALAHTHDDRYYTESETDTKLSALAPTTNTMVIRIGQAQRAPSAYTVDRVSYEIWSAEDLGLSALPTGYYPIGVTTWGTFSGEGAIQHAVLGVANPTHETLFVRTASSASVWGAWTTASANVHAARTDNPHGVTKADVGLDQVANAPRSGKVDAEAGTDNSLYMTPLRTAQAIAAIPPASHVHNESEFVARSGQSERAPNAYPANRVTYEEWGSGDLGFMVFFGLALAGQRAVATTWGTATGADAIQHLVIAGDTSYSTIFVREATNATTWGNWNEAGAKDHTHPQYLLKVDAQTTTTVAHGTNGGTARPLTSLNAPFDHVRWEGSAEPTNAIDGDDWAVTP